MKKLEFYTLIVLVITTVAFALSGCASTIPAVVKVDVPVPVTCVIKAPEVPAYAVDSLPIGADIWDKMAALRADRITRKAYEAELEAAIKSCQ